MLIEVKRRGRYYCVEGNDCLIFYYLFNFRLNDNKCYFNKKYLNRVLYLLVKNNISFKINEELLYKDYNSKNTYYIELGKDKIIFEENLLKLKEYLFNIIDNRNFNKVYNQIIKMV